MAKEFLSSFQQSPSKSPTQTERGGVNYLKNGEIQPTFCLEYSDMDAEGKQKYDDWKNYLMSKTPA